MALRRETVALRRGSTSRCRCPDGPGKALKLTVHPVRAEIPLYLAAVGPKNLELTGEIADGWLAIFFSPEHAGERSTRSAAARAAAGRAQAGDPMAGFDVVATVPVVLGDDVAAAARPVRAVRRALRRRHGQPGAELLQRARPPDGLRRGRRSASRTSTSTGSHAGGRGRRAVRVHRRAPLIGPPERIADRLAAYAEAGVTTLSVAPSAPDLDANGSERCACSPSAVDAAGVAS